jgi:hypothetical protein
MLWQVRLCPLPSRARFLEVELPDGPNGEKPDEHKEGFGVMTRTHDGCHLMVARFEKDSRMQLKTNHSFRLPPTVINDMAIGDAGWDAFLIQDSSLIRVTWPFQDPSNKRLSWKARRSNIWQPNGALTHAELIHFNDTQIALLLGTPGTRNLILMAAPVLDLTISTLSSPTAPAAAVSVVRDAREMEPWPTFDRVEMLITLVCNKTEVLLSKR